MASAHGALRCADENMRAEIIRMETGSAMSEILVTGGAISAAMLCAAWRKISRRWYMITFPGSGLCARIHFIEGDIGDYEALTKLFRARKISCVMNFARALLSANPCAIP